MLGNVSSLYCTCDVRHEVDGIKTRLVADLVLGLLELDRELG
jgi:hypothetical protein